MQFLGFCLFWTFRGIKGWCYADRFPDRLILRLLHFRKMIPGNTCMISSSTKVKFYVGVRVHACICACCVCMCIWVAAHACAHVVALFLWYYDDGGDTSDDEHDFGDKNGDMEITTVITVMIRRNQ